uniref:Uncharacterized protein n=1 Tax=viral metagenome TaxID=1070528 RepID=A0A6M3XT35_9ZZZZ
MALGRLMIGKHDKDRRMKKYAKQMINRLRRIENKQLDKAPIKLGYRGWTN